MTTPLGLARDLRLAFPEFIQTRVVRNGAYRLRAYCAIDGPEVSAARLADWSVKHIMAGSLIEFEQVAGLPIAADEEEELLRRTTVPRIVAETANTSGPGLVKVLRNLFPDEVVDVVGDNGHVTLHVDPAVPPSRDQELLDATRLLMGLDAVSLVVSRQLPTKARAAQHCLKESAATFQLLRQDQARLFALAPGALTATTLELPALPDGAATYASPLDGVGSLLQRLAVFDRVYVYMPFDAEAFPTWAGASLDEFLAVLPTGRVIPVFGQHWDRYEAGLITRVVDAGPPRIMLQGEHALRTALGVRSDHRALSIIDTEAGAQVRTVLAGSSDPDLIRLSTYLDALAEMASRFPAVAITGASMGAMTHPFVEWIDELRTTAGHASRAVELSGAAEHRAITLAIGGVPMTQAGGYFDSALSFLYAAEPSKAPLLRVPDPEMIGRICFPNTKGLTLLEFTGAFQGPRIAAMRELMASTRVQTADGSEDLVKKFNEELSTYSRRAERGYVAVMTVFTVIGAFAAGVPTALASLSIELARRVAGRKAPGGFATFASAVTSTTREAALLARVQTP